MSEQPLPSQFSIGRLFWMLLVAALLLTLANRLGLKYLFENLTRVLRHTSPVQSFTITAMIVFIVVLFCLWVAWIIFRLPYIVASIRYIMRRQKERRSELEKEVLQRGQNESDRE